MTESMLLQKLSAQLNRTRLSSDDVSEALKYIEKFLENTNDVVLKRALLIAAVVCYALPFTNNQNVPTEQATSQLGVNLKNLFRNEELSLHEKLISLRNEAVAHIEYDRNPVKRLEGTASGFSMSGPSFDLLNEGIDLKLLADMCSALKGHCVKVLLKLNEKIVEIESGNNK
jgi:hypothetical protein